MRFPDRPFARDGAGNRPSISGWRSSCAGTFWLTGCAQRPRLGSHVNNLMHCYSTRLLGAATRISMRKKPTVDLDSQPVQTWWEQCKEWMEYFKGHSVSGFSDQQSRLQVLRGKEKDARTEIETFMEPVQRSGRPERALTSSSDIGSCRM